MSHDFARVGETVRYQGRMVRMSTLHIEAPDGGVHDRDYVHHPGAVAVVPVLDYGSIVLVRQYRSAIDRPTLELPAGVRDKDGEDAAGAAARELAEETGYVADSMEHLVTVHTAPGFSNEEITIFLARGLTLHETEYDGVEEQHMTTETLTRDEVLARIAAGELTDAKTVLAVHMLG